jgi:hypothetical protein
MQNYPTDSDRLDSGAVYQQAGSFYGYTRAEILTQQALQSALIPGQWLAENVRPPLPQIKMFPPRFGYMDYTERQFSIGDVLSFPGSYNNNRNDISGGPGEINASSRNVSESNTGW